MSKRSPRLLFTDEELAAPELKKAIRKADKRMKKLEKAEAKIPKKTVKRKQRTVDPQTGRVTTRLSFDEVDKKRPPSKLAHALRDAPGAAALSAVHREIREHEQDNVGVESAHGVEQAAERAVRLAQHAHRSHKEKPYRRADRAEVKADRANLRALDKTAQHHDPQFSSNPEFTDSLGAESWFPAMIITGISLPPEKSFSHSLSQHFTASPATTALSYTSPAMIMQSAPHSTAAAQRLSPIFS